MQRRREGSVGRHASRDRDGGAEGRLQALWPRGRALMLMTAFLGTH